jgi:hypothetical protein
MARDRAYGSCLSIMAEMVARTVSMLLSIPMLPIAHPLKQSARGFPRAQFVWLQSGKTLTFCQAATRHGTIGGMSSVMRMVRNGARRARLCTSNSAPHQSR